MSEFAPQKTKKLFPKSRRLLRHADFERVYKQGRRHFAAHMTVFYLRRPADDKHGQSGLRVGFTVGKVLGGSVQRNRLRRRLREAVRLNGLQGKANADVVINPKRSLLGAEFTDLQSQIAKAFEVIERILRKEQPRN
jgi:ribonuclease P protein component